MQRRRGGSGNNWLGVTIGIWSLFPSLPPFRVKEDWGNPPEMITPFLSRSRVYRLRRKTPSPLSLSAMSLIFFPDKVGRNQKQGLGRRDPSLQQERRKKGEGDMRLRCCCCFVPPSSGINSIPGGDKKRGGENIACRRGDKTRATQWENERDMEMRVVIYYAVIYIFLYGKRGLKRQL